MKCSQNSRLRIANRPISRYPCQRFVVAAALITLAIVSAGCASLVRPNYETAIVKLRPGNYTLDPDHTFVLFRVDHLGLSKVVGRFNEATASLDFDPDNIESLTLDGRIKTASIDIGDEGFENQLRGAAWLNSDQFPDASFITESVVQGDENNFLIVGEFTLRGVTQPMQLQARFNGGADNILSGKYTIGFSASGEFSRKSFGIDDFGALVGDTIEIEIEAEFQQQ